MARAPLTGNGAYKCTLLALRRTRNLAQSLSYRIYADRRFRHRNPQVRRAGRFQVHLRLRPGRDGVVPEGGHDLRSSSSRSRPLPRKALRFRRQGTPRTVSCMTSSCRWELSAAISPTGVGCARSAPAQTDRISRRTGVRVLRTLARPPEENGSGGLADVFGGDRCSLIPGVRVSCLFVREIFGLLFVSAWGHCSLL